MPVECADLSGKDLLVDANSQISLAYIRAPPSVSLVSRPRALPSSVSRSSMSERRYCLTRGVVASAASSRNRAAVWKGSIVVGLANSFPFLVSVICRAAYPALSSTRLEPMTSLPTSSHTPTIKP
jgi:hypothetical protein